MPTLLASCLLPHTGTAVVLPPCAEHYPYLLVSIGSGVSMVRVDGENKFTRVSGAALLLGAAAGCRGLRCMQQFVRSPATATCRTPKRFPPTHPPTSSSARRRPGTNIGGGTFWGLCKLLTGLANFDDILALSSLGDNSNVRRLVYAWGVWQWRGSGCQQRRRGAEGRRAVRARRAA